MTTHVNPIDEDLDRELDDEYLKELAERMTDDDWSDLWFRTYISPSQWALVIAGSERLGVDHDFTSVKRRNGIHDEMIDWARLVDQQEDLRQQVKVGALSLLGAYVCAKTEIAWTEARDAVVEELKIKFPGMHAAFEAGEAPLETILDLVHMELPPEPDSEQVISLAYDWQYAAANGTQKPRPTSTTWPYNHKPSRQRRRGRPKKD